MTEMVQAMTYIDKGDGKGFSGSWKSGFASRTELAGGFVAEMFSEDLVAWRRHVMETHALDASFVNMRAILDDMRSSNPTEPRAVLSRKYRDLENYLFAQGEAWWKARQEAGQAIGAEIMSAT